MVQLMNILQDRDLELWKSLVSKCYFFVCYSIQAFYEL